MTTTLAAATHHGPQRPRGTDTRKYLCVSVSLWFVTALFTPALAQAQIRGFADVGSTTFTAATLFLQMPRDNA